MSLQLDKYDRIIACSSGVITATLDVLYEDDISLMKAHKWGSKEKDKFVLKVAKKKGYKVII